MSHETTKIHVFATGRGETAHRKYTGLIFGGGQNTPVQASKLPFYRKTER